MEHVVDLAVPVEDYEDWTRINTVVESVVDTFPGTYIESAGTGFGCRDIQILTPTRHKAKKVRKALCQTDLQFEYIGIAPIR